MSKIVVDAREYTSSTGRYTFRLLQYLEKIDDHNDYIVLLRPHDMDAYEFSNPRFTKLACPYKEFTFSEQIPYLKQVRSLKADLVHFAITNQPVLYSGRTVTTVHDITNAVMDNRSRYRHPVIFKFKQLVYRWVIRRVARKSAAVITPTKFVQKQVSSFARIPDDKITVTYEAADRIPDPPAPLPDLQNKEFIMYVGRPTPHKNLDRLVEAFAQLQESRPSLHLALVGKKDSNYERLEGKVSSRALNGVVFTGFASEGQLRWLYENCAAYVFPSLSEGFGLPGLEAMMHGAPVVSSNATCLPEVYGDAANYFDPTDVRAMANAINEVLTDEALRKQLAVNGKRRASQYSWQRMAEQTLEVYTRALAE